MSTPSPEQPNTAVPTTAPAPQPAPVLPYTPSPASPAYTPYPTYPPTPMPQPLGQAPAFAPTTYPQLPFSQPIYTPPTFAPRPPANWTWLRVAALIIGLLLFMLILPQTLPFSVVSARQLAYPKPNVSVSVSTSSPHVGDQVTFSASSTAGRDLSYTWEFSDGGSARGAQVTRTFSEYNAVTATVTVTDGIGQIASASERLDILPAPPVASFTITNTDTYFYSVGVDASASSGVQLSYRWDWGDGSSPETAYTFAYHYYQSPGVYTITLIVTDVAGQSSTATQQVSF